MSELKDFLINISEEKREKIIPENIKKGIKIFDIEGELESGVDTSDANVIPSKMAMGYSGYVNGQKVEGEAFDVGTGSMDYSVYDITLDENEQRVRLTLKMAMDYLINMGGEFVATPRYSHLATGIGLTADQIVEGNTILGIEGTAKTGANFTITNGKYLFAENSRLELIDILLPLCDIITAESMFYFYPSADLDCSKLNTSKVENMSRMFMQSQALTNLNIGHFDMSNVTNMSYMFTNCTKLSNETLNTILLLCSNASKVTHAKKLSEIGITEAQAEICETLSNFETFINSGWLTGYLAIDEKYSGTVSGGAN